MTDRIDRRSFVTAATSALGLPLLAGAQPSFRKRRASGQRPKNSRNDRGRHGPVVISSANGLRATDKAMSMLGRGADPLDAIVAGVAIIEGDPNDMSVGFGGLPNEEGVVELDSCVMHGPMARSGAVASLRNIKHPVMVAREVARRTDHCLLVGEGALKFAKRLGFKEENLLTEKSRQAWLKWRATLNRNDDWLQEDEFDLPTTQDKRGAQLPLPPGEGRGEGLGAGHADPSLALGARKESKGSNAAISSLSPRERPGVRGLPTAHTSHTAKLPLGDHITWIDGVPYTTGTIHCSARTGDGDLAGCTTTSGLSWKLPGRVGDSPIIGAGCFTDNEIGSAGATGRGEAVIQTCGAHTVVMRMDAGDSPTDACLYALKLIADRTKPARLLDNTGRPNFQVVYYALRKDGAYGSASMWSGRQFSIHDGVSNRHEPCAYLYER